MCLNTQPTCYQIPDNLRQFDWLLFSGSMLPDDTTGKLIKQEKETELNIVNFDLKQDVEAPDVAFTRKGKH